MVVERRFFFKCRESKIKGTFNEEFFSIVYTFAARGVFVQFLRKFFKKHPLQESIWNVPRMIVRSNTKRTLEPDFSISGQGHGHVTSKLVLRKP